MYVPKIQNKSFCILFPVAESSNLQVLRIAGTDGTIKLDGAGGWTMK